MKCSGVPSACGVQCSTERLVLNSFEEKNCQVSLKFRQTIYGVVLGGDFLGGCEYSRASPSVCNSVIARAGVGGG